MKQIKTKLRSRKGASMIIALVFMLFCACIGGVVLAAATANGGRIRGLSSDQQLSLREQSAIRILKKELSDLDKMTLTFSDVTREKFTYHIDPDSPTHIEIYDDTPDSTETFVTIEAKNVPSGGFNVIQQLLLEKTVYKFIEEHGITNYSDVKLKNFKFKTSTASTPNDFTLFPSSEDAVKETSIALTDPFGYDIPILVNCSEEEKDYTFYISLGSSPRIAIQVPMVIGDTKESTTSHLPGTLQGEDFNPDSRIDDTSESFSIKWFDMIISKGGAAE